MSTRNELLKAVDKARTGRTLQLLSNRVKRRSVTATLWSCYDERDRGRDRNREGHRWRGRTLWMVEGKKRNEETIERGGGLLTERRYNRSYFEGQLKD